MMLPYFAEVIASDISDHIGMLRFDAMKRVQGYLHHYEKLGYMPKLLCAIAEKKCEYIMAVTTKADVEQIVNPAVRITMAASLFLVSTAFLKRK